MQNKYLQIVEKINYYLFVVAICMLPFPTRISLYAWVIWLFSWLLEGRFLRRENLKWHIGLLPVILFVIWVVWECISYIWAINKLDAANMLIRHISFIGITPLALWGVNSRYNWLMAAKCFIASCILSLLCYSLYIHVFQHWSYIDQYQHWPDYFSTWRYFGDQISYFKHRLYYGTILNIAIVVLLQIKHYTPRTNHKNVWKRLLFILSLAVLVIGIIWTGSRANMLTLLVVSAAAIILPLRGRIRYLVASLVCVMTIMFCSLLFTLHPRFEKLQIEHITERETYSITEIEPRINIWYGAVQSPEDYWWYGVGVGGNTEYLKPVFASLNWQRFYERQYNAHNQYLGMFINLGVFGAVFFLLIYLLYPCWYKGRVRQFATLSILVLGLNMLTENMLDRIDGVIITCAILLIVSLLARAKNLKDGSLASNQ